MATVVQLMHRDDALPIVDHKTPMQDALITMTSKGFGIAVVIQEGVLLGVITDGDLRRHMDTLMQATAGGYCGAKPCDSHPRYVRSRGVEHYEHKENQRVIGG